VAILLLLLLLLMVLHVRGKSCGCIVPPVTHCTLERLLVVMSLHVDFQMITAMNKANIRRP
jgi:hypothetical protein